MNKTYQHWDGKTITENTDHIKIKEHVGEWYVINAISYHGQRLFLLEHEDYGDETPCLIVTATGHIKLEDCYNGFDELDN